MRTLRDSINPLSIPAGTPLVGGYVDGRYGPAHASFGEPGWDPASWQRFPGSVLVRIAVFSSTNDGVVGDVEFSDMTNAGAVAWVVMRRAAGVDPTLYTFLANWSALRSTFAGARVPEPHWWIAWYDGTTNIPTGAVARQYDDGTGFVGPSVGGAYDNSSVLDNWPGVDDPVSGGVSEVAQLLVAARPDGSGEDFYSLVPDPSLPDAFKLVHEFDSGDTTPRTLDYPPGQWLVLHRAGVWNGIHFVRGVGTDKLIWQVTFNPAVDATWQGPFKVLG